MKLMQTFVFELLRVGFKGNILVHFCSYTFFQADKAEAEKIEVVKNAEADAESKYLTGVGIAR